MGKGSCEIHSARGNRVFSKCISIQFWPLSVTILKNQHLDNLRSTAAQTLDGYVI